MIAAVIAVIIKTEESINLMLSLTRAIISLMLISVLSICSLYVDNIASPNYFDMVPGAGLEPARHCWRGILSPCNLPIPPPGLNKCRLMYFKRFKKYMKINLKLLGLRPESNRRKRLCRPLHDHSATQPKLEKY